MSFDVLYMQAGRVAQGTEPSKICDSSTVAFGELELGEIPIYTLPSSVQLQHLLTLLS